MSLASFYQLYRRSKYQRCEAGDDQPGSPRQNRKELFAVAALGLTLKHDTTFRAQFLKSICRETEDADYGIYCEKHHCSDLTLTGRDGKKVIVIEAKIKAGLASKQNPNAKEFEHEYGRQLRGCYPQAREIKYVVLQEVPEVEPGKHANIVFWGESWSKLAAECTESPLVTDLFDLLMYFGIAGFQFRQFKNRSMSLHTRSSAEMFLFFTQVAAELGIQKKAISWDVGTTPEGSHFGFDFERRSPEFSKAIEVIGRGVKGWVGFEECDGSVHQSVWFYCDDEDESMTFQQHCQGLLSEFSAKIYKSDDGRHFALRRTVESTAMTEAAWFQNVFQRLGSKH